MINEVEKKVEEDDLGDDKAYKIYTQRVEQKIHHVYLTESITCSEKYAELLNQLRLASVHDQFRFYLNNFGGYLHTGIQIINAINECEAKVVMVVDAPIYSMASLLALCGNEIIINDNSFLMFHDYSGGTVGKGNELFTKAINDREYTAKLFTYCAYPFLSFEEINNICEGKDLYVSAEDARKRFKKLNRKPKNVSDEVSGGKKIQSKSSRKIIN